MRININGLFDIVQHQFRPDVAMDENTMDITLEDFENIIKAPTKETNKRKINLNLVRM